MSDYSHLDAIQERIHRETMRFMSAHNEGERQFRFSQVMQAKRELEAEYRFLGLTPVDDFSGSDDELLRELQS